MATPSTEYPSLALIRQGIDYRFKVKLRGLELILRPLSIMEEDQIAETVINELSKMPEIQQTSMKQSMLLSILKLEMAQTSDVGKSDQKVFANELQRFTPGEIDGVFKQYVAGCDKLNPVLETMPVEEVDKWIGELKKNSTSLGTTLIDASFFQLVNLSRRLLTRGESQEGS